jgi:hypothetical protein
MPFALKFVGKHIDSSIKTRLNGNMERLIDYKNNWMRLRCKFIEIYYLQGVL